MQPSLRTGIPTGIPIGDVNDQMVEPAIRGERGEGFKKKAELRLIRVTSPEFSQLAARRGALFETWFNYWNSLTLAERDPTTHPVWIVSWLNAFAAEPNDYFLAFLFSSNQIVGAALFREESRLTPLGWATDLVCPENAHSFGESVAIAQGYHAAFFDRLFAATTPLGKRPCRALFSRVDGKNLLLSTPRVHRFAVERDPRSVLDTSRGLAGVSENFSKNFRGNLRKARNKLNKSGGVVYEVHTARDSCESAYSRFIEVESSGWKAQRLSAIRDRADRLQFYLQLLLGFAENQQAILTLMRIGDTDIAGQFCVQFGETLCIFKIGYREEYAQFCAWELADGIPTGKRLCPARHPKG